MPVKNAKLYLEECLDSIIDQEYQNWELIAINDHSSDGSEKTLEAYAKKDKRISWQINNGNGIIEALRLAYQLSSGQFYTRMDADDLMEPTKLQIMYDQLLENGIGHLALGKVKYFSENKLGEGYKRYALWLNELTEQGDNWKDIFKECVIPSPCWMVHKTDLEKARAFESDLWPEDYDLCFRFYLAGLRCIPSNKVLHHWRDYTARTSRNDPHYSDNRFFELKLKYFLQMYPRNDQQLVLLGAGKKGKAIADSLNKEKQNFKWLSNNVNKIGKEIYGNIIEAQDMLSQIDQPCVMIAISNPEEQKQIEKILLELGLIRGDSFFFFC